METSGLTTILKTFLAVLQVFLSDAVHQDTIGIILVCFSPSPKILKNSVGNLAISFHIYFCGQSLFFFFPFFFQRLKGTKVSVVVDPAVV